MPQSSDSRGPQGYRQIHVWLRDAEADFLQDLSKSLELSMSATIRQMLRRLRDSSRAKGTSRRSTNTVPK
jgi:hypothetical protein